MTFCPLCRTRPPPGPNWLLTVPHIVADFCRVNIHVVCEFVSKVVEQLMVLQMRPTMSLRVSSIGYSQMCCQYFVSQRLYLPMKICCKISRTASEKSQWWVSKRTQFTMFTTTRSPDRLKPMIRNDLIRNSQYDRVFASVFQGVHEDVCKRWTNSKPIVFIRLALQVLISFSVPSG